MKPMTAQEKIEFDLAVKIGLPKYFIFEGGRIIGRKGLNDEQDSAKVKEQIDKCFEEGDLKQLHKIKEALQTTMKFCEECKMITKHRNGNCITCESDYYADNYDRGK